MEQSTTSTDETVGITLISGFLGSGKSTLIRRILTENHGLRIVVVENEFGSTTAIEQAIVTQGGKDSLEEFIELPNGCICCQAQGDLVDSLTRLVDRKRGRFDHILVEASGLADPRPVAASFWVDAVADASLRLDSVVSVVDASRLGTGGDLQNSTLAKKQVAVADIVLLNKMDLITKSQEEENGSETNSEKEMELTEMLRQNGCVARVIPTVKCDVDIKDLLNIRAYNSDAAIMELRTDVTPEKFKHHVHMNSVDSHDGDENNDKLLATFTITFQDIKFDSLLMDRVLGHLLWDQLDDIDPGGVVEDGNEDEKQQQIWRMKSLVVMHEEKFKWIYQSVHTLFDDMVSSVSSSDGISQFLFIGQNMDKQTISDCLKQAATNSSPSAS